MKVRIACISVALAAALPATAADWNDGAGSLKDMSGSAAVAVPAPVPVQTYRGAWYFRIDGGIGSIDTPSLLESGLDIGDQDGPAAVLPATGPDYRATQPDWFSSDFSTFATVGGGAGYTFSNGFRVDATIEKRFKDDVTLSGTDTWDTHALGCGGCWVPVANSTTNFEITDTTKIDATVWMVNAYYDLFSNRGFTPYIGAGIGFAWNQLNRHHESTYSVCDTLGDPTCAAPIVTTESGAVSADKLSFAAAAMAGISYDVSEITTVDLGYRYLYIAGSDVALDINDDISRVEIGDQHIHQFRAGLRFNVN